MRAPVDGSFNDVADSFNVIVAACGVIARLCRCGANQVTIGRDGIALLLKVFQSQRGSVDVVDAVCRAMSNLASNNGTLHSCRVGMERGCTHTALMANRPRVDAPASAVALPNTQRVTYSTHNALCVPSDDMRACGLTS